MRAFAWGRVDGVGDLVEVRGGRGGVMGGCTRPPISLPRTACLVPTSYTLPTYVRSTSYMHTYSILRPWSLNTIILFNGEYTNYKRRTWVCMYIRPFTWRYPSRLYYPDFHQACGRWNMAFVKPSSVASHTWAGHDCLSPTPSSSAS